VTVDAGDAEWMTVAEVADRFGVGVRTVRTWVRRGLLPGGRWGAPGSPGAPRIRIRRADVRAFAERHSWGQPRPAWLDAPDPPSPT
jgi:excisionase family DNA binding protein